MPYLLALDQGTTSSRAILFDEEGQQVAVEQRETKQIYPQAGWVEQDAAEIWQTQLSVAEAVLDQAHLAAADIAAIGITNQRETVVAWDRQTGEPLCNAIVWQDRRTAKLCGQLRAEGREDWVTQKTGLLFDPYFSGTKMRWLLENEPAVGQAFNDGRLAVGTIDSWLIFKLTGGKKHVTDATNASRTLLMDIHRGAWDEELLDYFGISGEVLPNIVDSSGVCGEVAIESPLQGLLIAGIAGDQQAALFGQACFEPGAVKNTYGTGCFALMQTGTEAPHSENKLLTTIASQVGGSREYALEGSVFTGGAVVGWLRDGLGILRKSADVESLAAKVDNNGGLYLVPAFAGLGAPHWDPYARGTLIGITGGTTAGHIARAALESIALQSVELIEAMRADSGESIDELRVDGGATANDLLMQIQADLLQRPVVRPAVTETTALGAAYLAGIGTGVWKDRQAVAQQWREAQRYEPQMSATESEEIRGQWNRAVERAAGWVEESK